jgi:hypothetical protein
METLFLIEAKFAEKFCRTCEHRERHHCGSKVIQYCGIRKSNRTDNGKMKIKVNLPACLFYKEVTA